VISSLTALIATCVAVYPLIKQATAKHQSVLIARYGGTNQFGFRAIVINSGDRPAVVQEGKIYSLPGLKESTVEFSPEGHSGVLVRPGEAVEIPLIVYGYDMRWSKIIDGRDCKGEIMNTSFSGARGPIPFQAPCFMIASAVREVMAR
jgi:hypothetical protein